VTTYLLQQLECKEKELFVVVTSEVEQNQSWQCGPHDEKRVKENTVDEPVAYNHSHVCLEALLPDFNTCCSTRITPSQDNKTSIDGIALADGNVDSVSEQLMFNISNKRTISSPLLESNR